MARYRLVLASLVAIGLATGIAAATRGQVEHAPRVCGEPCFSLVLTGDIMLGDGARDVIAEHGFDYPLARVLDLIDADYAIGNAEAPITRDSTPYDPARRWSYNAEPECAAALSRAGFDAMSLANNHLMDRGPGGITDTLRHLRDAHLIPFGAGMNRTEADEPLIVDSPAGKIAIVAMGHDRESLVATADRAGITPLTTVAIDRGIALARARGARIVIAYVHWGDNYATVSVGQRLLAHALAAAGYDLVIGHHPHVPQRADVVGGVPVLFSLGNFVFGTPGRYRDEFPGQGLVARVKIDTHGIAAVELRCVETDNALVDYQPRACSREVARAVFARFAPTASVEGDVATLGP